MPINVYNLGTASGTAGATVALSGITVPAGAFIFVAAYEKNTGGQSGTISDGSNSFPQINSASVGTAINGRAQTFEAFNCNALTGGTLTYTKGVSGVFASISVFYATGILRTRDPLDTGSITQNSFTDNSPNDSSTLSFAGQLVVGAVFWVAGVGDTFSQDTADGWSFPPNVLIDSAGAAGIGGGFLLPDVSNNSPFYGPLLNNSRTWIVFMQAFQAEQASGHDNVNLFAVGNY